MQTPDRPAAASRRVDPKRQPPVLYSGWRDLGFNWTWHLGIYTRAAVKRV